MNTARGKEGNPADKKKEGSLLTEFEITQIELAKGTLKSVL